MADLVAAECGRSRSSIACATRGRRLACPLHDPTTRPGFNVKVKYCPRPRPHSWRTPSIRSTCPVDILVTFLTDLLISFITDRPTHISINRTYHPRAQMRSGVQQVSALHISGEIRAQTPLIRPWSSDPCNLSTVMSGWPVAAECRTQH